MKTVDFLRRILPEQGLYYVALMRKGTGGVAHVPFEDIDRMGEFIESVTRDHPEKVVYHANSSFKNKFVLGDLNEPDKKCYRVARNQGVLRAFWLDIDTGAERVFDKNGNRNGYTTKNEAKEALLLFCRTVGMPLPMIIDSGHGLHCYWVLEQDVSPANWLEVAPMLAACLSHIPVYVDTSCTTDSRRILRPVGTVNRKPGKPERTVKLVHEARPIAFDTFKSILEQFVETHDVQVIYKDTYNSDLNSDLTAHLGSSIPSWGETIAQHCAQVDAMRITEGDVTYELWRAVGGLLKHCVDGQELAIKWTARRHIAHDKTDIMHEMDTWKAGPPRCSHFQTHNPKGCDNCPQAGKVKSPIVLGYRDLVTAPTEQAVLKDGEEIVTTIPEFPRGFSFSNNLMCRSIENEDKIDVVPFSPTLFYARRRVRKDDGRFAVTIRAHMPREGLRDFEIDQSSTTLPNDLLRVMAANQIQTTHNKNAGQNMTAYLKDWIDKLIHNSDEQRTYQSFGWHDNMSSFLLGDRLYCSDGNVREVVLGGRTKSKMVAFPSVGDLKIWSDAINEMYNKQGEEHRQYAIASSFGCALTPFSGEENFNGILFAITGERTSKGKTTVAQAALSVWGEPKKFTFASEAGATVNSTYAHLGVFQNMPILFDEFTHINANDFSKMCYTVSSGIEKSRMVSGTDGVGFADTASWRLTPYITANKDLHTLLSTRGNSEAEAVRLIQISIDDHQVSSEDKLYWQDMSKLVAGNCGAAGDAFIRYVSTHSKEIPKLMRKWMTRAIEDVSELKYRFYRGHLECTMTALEICVQLGILKFDVEAVYQYAVGLFQKLASNVDDMNTVSPEDAISEMISALSSGIAVTSTYRDLRKSGSEPDRVFIHDEWHGRAISGFNGVGDLSGHLFLSRKSVKNWCLANRQSFAAMIIEMKQIGIWLPLADDRFTLGRGTSRPSGQTRVIAINFFKFEERSGKGLPVAVLEDTTNGQKPVPLQPQEPDQEQQAVGA